MRSFSRSIVAGSLGLLGGLHLASASLAADDITVALAVSPGVQYSEIWFGKELGIFEEEGLNPDIVSFNGAGLVIPQVANKSLTFGYSANDLLISAIARNEPFPVKFIYSHLRSGTNSFTVLSNSDIKSYADLKGKKVGVYTLSTSIIQQSRAAFNEIGLDWDKEVEMVVVGVGPAAWKQLTDGNVDALNLFFSQDAAMRMAGIDIRQMLYPDSIRKMFGQGILAHEDTIRDNPGVVERFGRALAKSTVACEANRDACIRAFWKAFPESRPTPDKEEAAMATAKSIYEATFTGVSDFDGGERRWGGFTPGSVDPYANYVTGGKTNYSWDDLFTNQFVDAYNDFSPEEYAERARSAK